MHVQFTEKENVKEKVKDSGTALLPVAVIEMIHGRGDWCNVHASTRLESANPRNPTVLPQIKSVGTIHRVSGNTFALNIFTAAFIMDENSSLSSSLSSGSILKYCNSLDQNCKLKHLCTLAQESRSFFNSDTLTRLTRTLTYTTCQRPGR